MSDEREEVMKKEYSHEDYVKLYRRVKNLCTTIITTREDNPDALLINLREWAGNTLNILNR